jgi:hypothetical protein
MTSLYDYEVRTPLRFRQNEILLNRNKRGCKNDCSYSLINPFNYLMDFVITRELSGAPIKDFYIINSSGGTVLTLPTIEIKIFPYFDKEYLVFNGIYFDSGRWKVTDGCVLQLDCDDTYSVVVKDDNDMKWISEPFKPVKNYNTYGYKEYLLDGELNNTGYWDTTNLQPNTFFTGGLLCANAPASESYIQQNIGTINAPNGYIIVELQIGSGGSIPAGDVIVWLNGAVQCVFSMPSQTITVYCAISVTQSLTFNNVIAIGFSKGAVGCINNASVKEVSTEMDCYMKMEWESSCWIGNNPPSSIGGSIVNRFWFDADVDLSEPEYKITTEGKENGDKEFTATWSKRIKEYTFESGAVPEYVIDAFMDVKLHENKRIYYKNNLGYNNIKDLDITADWVQNEACYANLKYKLNVEDVIVKYGCCNDSWNDCWSCSPCSPNHSYIIPRIFDEDGNTILSDPFEQQYILDVNFFPMSSSLPEPNNLYAHNGSSSLYWYEDCKAPDPCGFGIKLMNCAGVTEKNVIEILALTSPIYPNLSNCNVVQSAFLFKENKWKPAIEIIVRNEYDGTDVNFFSTQDTLIIKPEFPELEVYPNYQIFYTDLPCNPMNIILEVPKFIAKNNPENNPIKFTNNGQTKYWLQVNAINSNCCNLSSPVYYCQLGRKYIFNADAGYFHSYGGSFGNAGYIYTFDDLNGNTYPVYDWINYGNSNVFLEAVMNAYTKVSIDATGYTVTINSVETYVGASDCVYRMYIDDGTTVQDYYTKWHTYISTSFTDSI